MARNIPTDKLNRVEINAINEALRKRATARSSNQYELVDEILMDCARRNLSEDMLTEICAKAILAWRKDCMDSNNLPESD